MYKPKIILVGNLKDKNNFEVVESIDEKIIQTKKFNQVVKKNFDYIAFVDDGEYMKHRDYLTKIIEGSQVTTTDFLLKNPPKNFYSYRNQYLLYEIIARRNILSLLDYDSYFASGQMYLKSSALKCPIDSICEKKNYPLIDSFYEKIFNSVEDCRLNHYDCILLTAQRNSSELLKIIESTMANEYIIFNRKSEDSVKNLLKIKNFPAQAVKCINGNYFLVNNRKSENISIFVVTHKKFEINLPQGYTIIHAGKILNEDLGYSGDDSADNISKLNPYLNELTAMYWIWKNTNYSYVGTAHYRRFFSEQNSYQYSEESILKPRHAYELLQKYDALIGREGLSCNTQKSLILYEDSDGFDELSRTTLNIIKKSIEKYQPKYLDSFEKIIYSQGFFYCNMIITRKKIFDELCKWLFSFMLPATDEFLKTFNVEELSIKQKRILGYCAERMMSVWLLKQNLRLKDFPIMVNK